MYSNFNIGLLLGIFDFSEKPWWTSLGMLLSQEEAKVKTMAAMNDGDFWLEQYTKVLVNQLFPQRVQENSYKMSGTKGKIKCRFIRIAMRFGHKKQNKQNDVIGLILEVSALCPVS